MTVTVTEEPTRLDGRYELVRELGRGGQGISWLALDRDTAQEVVVKELAFAGIDDWKPVELFEREAEVLRSLDHPGIPRFIDTFLVEADGDHRRYLVREYVAGESLEAVLDGGRHFRDSEAIDLARAVLRILDYLHSQATPIIHRDIKPANLIERSDGSIALLDFGVAQILGESVVGEASVGQTVVGTTGYIAPEQLIGHARPASDLYALGATLVHLLAHRHPALLPVQRLRVQFRDVAPVSNALADFLDRLLAPDLSERLQTAKKALVALRFDVDPPDPTPAPDEGDDDALAAWSSSLPALPRGSLIDVAIEPGRLEIELMKRPQLIRRRALSLAWMAGIAGLAVAGWMTGGAGFWVGSAVLTVIACIAILFYGDAARLAITRDGLELAPVRLLMRRTRVPLDHLRRARVRPANELHNEACVIELGLDARVPMSWRDINGDLLVERHLATVERRWLAETIDEAVRELRDDD